MQSKFEQVPVEKDTRVLYQHEARLGGYDVLHQMWCWDGVTAESVIFDSSDVSELSDQELEEVVRLSPMVKPNSSITLTRNASEFTYVSYNFES